MLIFNNHNSEVEFEPKIFCARSNCRRCRSNFYVCQLFWVVTGNAN